ncbi:PL29 family lyase N-terminal domain-containing protein [uncultured Alistipes sp.]|uniref:PL29 family lyase N-terminal domain-containing protein n=1 Tax=uncultured Alistipes sp. TaxID=538949 RepID=UPI002617E142|nr:PL29 family lyase N-terminal domain-containing protein [uncultured Alistipes sp.]
MKKILSVFCIATFLFASCSDEYDDSKLWQNVNDLKDRIAKLEETVQTMNSEIGSIQSIVDAVNERDYIVKIEELADKSGYSITFAKGNTITIKHGKDGNDGKNAPIIGIDLYEGVYYWTITTDGEKTWLLDHDGNKLKVSGIDGITPILGVDSEGYWTIDKGNGVERLKDENGNDIQAKGEDGDSFFSNVTYDDDSVHFTFADGEIVSIPLCQGVSFTVAEISDRESFQYGETKTYNVTQKNVNKIAISKPDGWKVSIQNDILTVTSPSQENTFAETNGEIAITAMGNDSQSFFIFSFSVKVYPSTAIIFTDPNFEDFCLANFDTNKDGYITSTDDPFSVKEMNCSNQNIKDFNQDIRQFLYLESIDCSYNQLTTWNVWGTSLKNINCSHNSLSELTIDSDPPLNVLNCSWNQITSLVLNNAKLDQLNCDSNELTNLDVDNCLNLSYLSCQSNNLKTLILHSEKLNTLFCGTNQLQTLDLTNCPNISVLSCEWNQLSNLILSNNEKLTGLVCHSNQLTSLDLSSCPNLKTLNCSGNPDLLTVYLKQGTSIESLLKDDHTQIIYK